MASLFLSLGRADSAKYGTKQNDVVNKIGLSYSALKEIQGN